MGVSEMRARISKIKLLMLVECPSPAPCPLLQLLAAACLAQGRKERGTPSCARKGRCRDEVLTHSQFLTEEEQKGGWKGCERVLHADYSKAGVYRLGCHVADIFY